MIYCICYIKFVTSMKLFQHILLKSFSRIFGQLGKLELFGLPSLANAPQVSWIIFDKPAISVALPPDNMGGLHWDAVPKIKGNSINGKIEIEYKSLEELNKIIGQIK